MEAGAVPTGLLLFAGVPVRTINTIAASASPASAGGLQGIECSHRLRTPVPACSQKAVFLFHSAAKPLVILQCSRPLRYHPAPCMAACAKKLAPGPGAAPAGRFYR